jgi:hypothetical membrane protein
LAILAITASESLTPGYSVSAETVSGLGSPIFSGICKVVPSCVAPVQPASAVFVLTFFLIGILQLWSGLILRGVTSHRRFALAISMVGAAYTVIGGTYLPFYLGGNSEGVITAAYAAHIAAAVVIFVLGSIVVVSTHVVTRAPFRYFGLGLGTFALAAFLVMFSGNSLGLGSGGIERMALYPLFLWAIGFGALLTAGQQWEA